MHPMNCPASGTYAQAAPGTGVFACTGCAMRWPPGSLIGGKIPAHPPFARSRVARATDPEALELDAIEEADPRPPGSRRDG